MANEFYINIYIKIIILIIFNLFFVSYYASNQNHRNQNHRNLNQQIIDIKNFINENNIDLKKYNSEIKKISKNIKEENIKIDNIQDSINNLNKKQQKLEKDLLNLKKSLSHNQEAIKNFIIITYRINNYPKLKLLLDSKITNWQLLLNYLKILNNYEKHNIDLIKYKIISIDNINDQLITTKQEFLEKNLKINKFKEELISLKQQKTILKDNLEHNINKNKNKLSELLTLINSQNKKFRYKNNSKNINNFNNFKKKFNLPVKGNILTKLENEIQSQLIQNGLFIRNNPNEKYIHSIYDGKVVFADWLKLYGNVIIIDHQNGYMSLYANNKEVFPKPGAYIQAGEKIAVIGNSGEFGVHGSYFELRYQGKPLNPIKWLKIG